MKRQDKAFFPGFITVPQAMQTVQRQINSGSITTGLANLVLL